MSVDPNTLNMRCPDCLSDDVADSAVSDEQPGDMRCDNCGAGFERSEAVVMVGDLEDRSDTWSVFGVYCGTLQRFSHSFEAPSPEHAERQAREWVAEQTDEGCYIAAVVPGEVRVAA